MNNPISSWLRKGAIPLALACLAGPALASRTVTASDSGGGGRNQVATGPLNTCGVDDFLQPADACSGFFNYGEDVVAVDSLVSGYDQGNANVAWGSTATQTYTQISGSPSTPSLFTSSAGNGVLGNIFFERDFIGSFVMVLSGTWSPPSTPGNIPPRADWSAYYLFDDVIASADPLQRMQFALYGADVPNTGGTDVYVMPGLTVDKVSIYQFDVTRTATVPEPSSLLLSGLALGALGAAAALARRRRLAAGSAPAL